MCRLRPLPLVLVLLAALPVQAAEKTLTELTQEYEIHLGRRDDVAYEGQRQVLAEIAERRSDEARATLVRLLDKYGAADRQRAALLLGALVRYGSPQQLDRVIDYVEERKDPLLLDWLHRIVAEVRLPGTIAYLRGGALRAATPRVKAQIVRALGASGDEAAVAPLLQLVREEDILVRVEVLEALGRLRSKRSFPVIQVFLRDASEYVRDAAARGLGLLGDERALPALERALDDTAPLVVESAAAALARIGDARAIPALIARLRGAYGRDLRLEDALVEALRSLTGKALPPDPEQWERWWATVKEHLPFVKVAEKPGTRTIPGPRYYGFPVRSSRVVFVLDVSRSMGWNGRLESAQRELIQVLEALPPTTRFNVVVYSDRAASWRRQLTEAKSEGVKSSAIAFVRRQVPQNGTNTYEALATAFQDPEADTIFFLSDGNPSVGPVTDPEQILMRVREWNRFRRVHIHGVALLRGQAPAAFRSLEDPERSYEFMKRLTEQNDGRLERVD